MRTRSEETGTGPPVAIGMDLGTCLSRMAIWRDGDVQLIPNERGRLATPSVVAYTEQSVLIGEAAEEQADANPENTIFAPQRLLGAKFDSPWVRWHMRTWPSKIVRSADGRPLYQVRDRGRERLLRPEDVVTQLVGHLRRIAERYLGARVAEVVVTVPAQFGQQQRLALMEACTAARMAVLDLVKCPTAAAVAFCFVNSFKTRQNLLVFDVGGNYFDFSLLSVEEGLLAERAVGTDYVNLDAALLRFCQRDLRERFGLDVAAWPMAQQRLRGSCEMAKRRLSQLNQASIEVKGLTKGVDYTVNVSRSLFEDFCHQDIEHLLDPIDWCLEIRRTVRNFFYGRTPHEVLRPDHGAVLGAALYVALISSTGPANGTAGPVFPEGLRTLRLQQVPVCGAVAEAEDAAVRSSEDLEPVPRDEGFSLPRALGRNLRPASSRCWGSFHPPNMLAQLGTDPVCKEDGTVDMWEAARLRKVGEATGLCRTRFLDV